MESSIAVFLSRQPACERLPTTCLISHYYWPAGANARRNLGKLHCTRLLMHDPDAWQRRATVPDYSASTRRLTVRRL